MTLAPCVGGWFYSVANDGSGARLTCLLLLASRSLGSIIPPPSPHDFPLSQSLGSLGLSHLSVPRPSRLLSYLARKSSSTPSKFRAIHLLVSPRACQKALGGRGGISFASLDAALFSVLSPMQTQPPRAASIKLDQSTELIGYSSLVFLFLLSLSPCYLVFRLDGWVPDYYRSRLDVNNRQASGIKHLLTSPSTAIVGSGKLVLVSCGCS